MVSEKILQTGVSTDQDTVLVTGQERTDSQIQTFDPLSHLFLNKVCFVQQNEATRGCVCTLVPVNMEGGPLGQGASQANDIAAAGF